MEYPLKNKSVEDLVKEANESLKNSKEMSEQEKIEYDSEYGYEPDECEGGQTDGLGQ